MINLNNHKFIKIFKYNVSNIKNVVNLQLDEDIGWFNGKYFQCEICKMKIQIYQSEDLSIISCDEYIIKNIIE